MTEYEQTEDVQIGEEGDDALKIAELNIEATTILISLHNLKVAIKNIEGNVRHYQRETVKFIRHLKKNQKNRSSKKFGEAEKREREPSGFAKKSKVKKELADFFRRPDVSNIIDIIMNEEDLKEDSKFEALDDENMINRPSATKIINRYIKEKNLQNQTNKQYIIPDDTLKKILAPLEKSDKSKGGYRCFNLQKYIKHLFVQ